MNKKPIAFFDSGIGGLTVFKKLKKLLPHENYIYFGDLKNIPYGEKSKEELIKIADRIFKFFEEKDVKAVVMACNTTSANTYDILKDKYKFKIYPIIQSCAKIITNKPLKKVGVFATEATIKSGVYSRELKKYNPALEVFEMSCPPWVGIVEGNTQNSPASVACVSSSLCKMLENSPEKIILGCTHYPYLLDILGKFLPKDKFIDPADYFAEFIKTDLAKQGMLNKGESGSEKFFVSANPEKFKQAASMFYPISELPQLVD
ncbi:MAG: glutamate racemase [Candidatus Gastranaerophilales bacterium]|nr:glutamate racemase [Candidatus Gastranaerophilales bacterium]